MRDPDQVLSQALEMANNVDGRRECTMVALELATLVLELDEMMCEGRMPARWVGKDAWKMDSQLDGEEASE